MLNINKQDKQIAQFLKDAGISYDVKLLQIGANQDDWKCDKWMVFFDSEGFTYHTGIGHRIPKKGFTGISKKDLVEVKKLKSLINRDRIPDLMQPTGNKVAIDHNKTIDSYRETVTIPPTQASVLYCLLSDMQCVECETFKGFCENLGYDIYSRKAEKVYFACQETTEQLRRVFSQKQIEEMQTILEDY